MSIYRLASDVGKVEHAETRSVARAGNKPKDAKGGGSSTVSNQTAPQQLASALGALTLWLPAEIIAAYAAFVTMLQPAAKDAAPVYSGWLWLIALVATPVTLGLTAWAQKTRRGRRSEASARRLGWSIGLSPIAFVLWSASVPNSAWNLLPWFHAGSAVALFGILVVTGFFTLIATKLIGSAPAPTDD